MRKQILSAISLISAGVWQVIWDNIRPTLYDRGSRMLTPIISILTIDDIIKWGPTIALVLIGCWLAVAQFLGDRKNNQIPRGSLKFESANVEIYHKISSGSVSGLIVFNLKNMTDRLLAFECIMYGDINGSPINTAKEKCTGYVYPNELAKFISGNAQCIIPNNNSKTVEPTFIGRLRYEIKFKNADNNKFNRFTAKTLIINAFNSLKGEPGISIANVNVVFSDSIEE